MSETKVERHNKRWKALQQERSSYIARWQDISSYILPYNGRFLATDHNKGTSRHNNIYDNTGTIALRNLAAGLMSGRTSPSSPWFSLSLADRELMKYQPVKKWLNDVTELMQDILSQSNVYRVLANAYKELGAFGTFAAFIDDSYNNVIQLRPFTAGEYGIASNWDGEIDTIYREFEVSVCGLVEEFGLENCSNTVKSLYERNQLDAWVPIIHVIEPRKDREYGKKDNKNFPFKSVYYEASGNNNQVLRESGYKTFPCIVPRWDVGGCDIYGNSPADDALGDIKALQQAEFRKLQAIDFKTNPPLQVPASLKNRDIERFPGGISYYDINGGTQGIKSLFEVNLDIRELIMSQQDIRERINTAFYSDIFLMITQLEGQKTAYEIAQRKEEKMMLLGSVIDRLNNELDDPLITTLFERLAAANMIPAPPEEMQGMILTIDHISILSAAQKASSVNGIDRFVSTIGQIATMKPEVLDKFDADYWVDIYSDKMGVDPELIVGGEQVALIRQQRAQQQQAMQQQQMLNQGSQTLKNAGQTSTEPGTAAGDILAMMRSMQ